MKKTLTLRGKFGDEVTFSVRPDGSLQIIFDPEHVDHPELSDMNVQRLKLFLAQSAP